MTKSKNTLPRLLILSDLWGAEKSDWVDLYKAQLSDAFEIQYYDCCALGAIDKSDYTEQALHTQFVAGGIDRAVEKLLLLEQNEVFVLAFSVGGSIAWKAALKGLKVKALHAVSSTRLRHETERPSCSISLVYGDQDKFKPDDKWLSIFKIDVEMVKHKSHQLYKDPSEIPTICANLLKTNL